MPSAKNRKSKDSGSLLQDGEKSKKCTNLYSSAQRMKYVKRMDTVAVVSETTPAVNAKNPKA